MPKGLSSVKTLSAREIAKKWNLPLSVVSKKIAAGVKVEKEHTKSTRQANEIARDHLGERPDYYDKLHKMEKQKVSVKENTTYTSGVAGLGFNTGTPAIDSDNEYTSTNSLAYDPLNGAKLDYIKRGQSNPNNRLGFKEFNPKKMKDNSNKDLAESLGSDYGTAAVPITGDLTGSSRKVMKEIKVPPKVKKAVATGMTFANLATLGQVAGDAAEGRKGVDPKRSVVSAASALPGAPGWAATGLNYTIKGFDKAREHLKQKEKLKEDLRKWFREKWVRYDTKGNIKGPCAREEGEGKPKCRPLASARAMSKDERAKSARRKRREDPVADRPGKGGKPVMVRTEETLMEKNVPTNPALWARAKAQARAKFDVYPSAYANGWASKWYKSKGGGWKTAANESIEEACWDTHRQEGMKKKGGKMVPNCVPKEEKNVVPANTTERGIYEKQIDEISAELVGKVHNKKYLEKGKAPSPTVARAVKKKWLESKVGRAPEEKKQVKEYIEPYFVTAHKEGEGGIRKRLGGRMSQTIRANKPDAGLHPGAKGMLDRTVAEVAMAMPPAIQPPAIHGPQVAGVKRQAPRELSGRATGRMAGQTGSMSAKPSVSRTLTRTGSASFGQVGAGSSTGMSPTKVGTSFSQGGVDVGRKMAASKQTSPVVKGMTTAGREAAATVSRAAPTAAKIAGSALRMAGGPAATAAMAVMSPTPAGAGEDEKKRQETLKSYNPYKSSGRSVSDYEKQALTPQKYDTPKAPKVDAPTPPERPKFFSRGQAFSAARGEAGGGEGKFSYDSKTYQTNVPGEKYKPESQLKQTSIKEETKMDTKELINEALDSILEDNLVEMKENFMTALNEKAMEKLEERKKAMAADYFAQ